MEKVLEMCMMATFYKKHMFSISKSNLHYAGYTMGYYFLIVM